MTITPDLEVQNEGSIYLLRPLTDAGTAWVDANVGNEETQYFGNAVVVEHRYIGAIVDGALADGLVVV